MARFAGARLLVWGVILGVPAFLVHSCFNAVNAPLQLKSAHAAGAKLEEEPFAVVFDPGKGPGVRMRFDVADAKPVAHTRFLAEHGYTSPWGSDTPVNAQRLEDNGFPSLELAWPSLHMPPQPLCASAAGDPKASCVVAATQLAGDYGIRGGHLMQGETWQWTAFRTRRVDDRLEWAGWECDPKRQGEGNREIKAPDAGRRQWALHPLQMQRQCARPQGLLEKHAPALAGYQENVALWSCDAPGDANAQAESGACTVAFPHRGRMLRLRVPGRAWTGDAEHQMPALLQLRPQLLEAAWRTLEAAAQEGREGAPAPDWQGALRRELAWCGEYAQRAAALQASGGDEAVRQAWERPHMRVTQAGHQGPCGRAFQRILHALDHLPSDEKPPPVLAASARQLADIEAGQRRSGVSRPLWALTRDLLAREGGPRSMALLQWRAQQFQPGQDEAEVLAHYDALREQVAQLPPPQRLVLRRGLMRHIRSDGPFAARGDELGWEFARDWLQHPGVLPLQPEEVLVTLTRPAAHAVRLPPEEQAARLDLLLPAMQAEAKRLAQDPQLLPRYRLIYGATLALHAAWYANRAAVQSPEGARWKQWLVEHAAWADTALPAAPRDWVQAVALHRDSALKNQLTEPNCPGGPLLRCSYAYEAPAIAGVLR